MKRNIFNIIMLILILVLCIYIYNNIDKFKKIVIEQESSNFYTYIVNKDKKYDKKVLGDYNSYRKLVNYYDIDFEIKYDEFVDYDYISLIFDVNKDKEKIESIYKSFSNFTINIKNEDCNDKNKNSKMLVLIKVRNSVIDENNIKYEKKDNCNKEK